MPDRGEEPERDDEAPLAPDAARMTRATAHLASAVAKVVSANDTPLEVSATAATDARGDDGDDEDGDDEDGDDEDRDDDDDEPEPGYGKAAILFALTVASVFFTGAHYVHAIPAGASAIDVVRALPAGYPFALPLLAILLTHEFGHFIAARLHGMATSLPFFIPMPILSPFGTWGAVIAMPPMVRRRDALLDTGAAGPLAGLLVAIPIWCVGIATSHVEPLGPNFTQEGQSLLYMALKRVFAGPIASGSDLSMNALAFAGWTGALITMMNLVPVGQLDGGHIAYALFGEKQNRYAVWLHRSLLVVFAFNLARFVIPALVGHASVGRAAQNSAFWLVWFFLIAGMRWFTGENHPPTEAAPLSRGRRVIAIVCLALFVLLFMPTPWAIHGDG